MLRRIETLIFCDETKFYIESGDHENAIYYLGVSVEKYRVPVVSREFNEILTMRRVKSRPYHSTSVFRNNRPRADIMQDLTELIIRNDLQCFCHKYPKDELFEKTQYLTKYNDEILTFEKVEFQALFYFLMILNTYIRDEIPHKLRREIILYFDKNVYGKHKVEEFSFQSEEFMFKQMTFADKKDVSLLALPDFIGYIFRKSKVAEQKESLGNTVNELEMNCRKSLYKLINSGLFHYITVNPDILIESLPKTK